MNDWLTFNNACGHTRVTLPCCCPYEQENTSIETLVNSVVLTLYTDYIGTLLTTVGLTQTEDINEKDITYCTHILFFGFSL